MRIIRYEDRSGKIQHAAEHSSGSMFLRMEGDVLTRLEPTREVAQIARLLTPINPVMIWCIGQNYREHANEVGLAIEEYPVVFAKGINAVQNPDAAIVLPQAAKSSEVDYEAELVVIIGKTCKEVSREDAVQYVAGYTCGNDVSARDWQLKKGGSQWSRGKSFDTFAPLGPCLVTPDSLPNPNALCIQTTVNGRLLQDANTSGMIRDVSEIIAFLSQSTTLLPGTAIFTGTPHGVGMARIPPVWLKNEDEVRVTIEGIGTLCNHVRGFDA